MIGGYKIIDLKNKAINTSTGTTIAGVYETIEGSTKPIVIEGLTIGTTEYKGIWANPYVVSGAYVINVGPGKITIDDDDKITYSAN